MIIPPQYTLPQIDFVEGSTQDFVFRCYSHIGKRPQDMSACTADFSVINYNNKFGKPLISKRMQIRADADAAGGVSNVLAVTLNPSDTVDLLAGKYIYQISIRDISGNIEIPNQGIIHIINNINKAFAR